MQPGEEQISLYEGFTNVDQVVIAYDCESNCKGYLFPHIQNFEYKPELAFDYRLSRRCY